MWNREIVAGSTQVEGALASTSICMRYVQLEGFRATSSSTQRAFRRTCSAAIDAVFVIGRIKGGLRPPAVRVDKARACRRTYRSNQ